MLHSSGPWTIVLAGGKGERLASFTQRWLGRYVPKQYCTFVGTRSMLQHTIDRARRVSTPERTVTVVAREHAGWVREQIRGPIARGVVFQPVDRDTAAGIFLPLTYVRHRDPDATVVIFPADHFVHPESRFIESVNAAVEAASSIPNRLVLLGVAPDGPEPDFGWILGGRNLTTVSGRPIRSVRAFVEKPPPELARTARDEGGLWNTMILAARVETLWRIGWRYVPEVLSRLDCLVEAIGTPIEKDVLVSVYSDMPRRNFSADVLQRARQEVAVSELRDVVWSDWGRAERITATLARMGKRPAWELAPQGALALAGV